MLCLVWFSCGLVCLVYDLVSLFVFGLCCVGVWFGQAFHIKRKRQCRSFPPASPTTSAHMFLSLTCVLMMFVHWAPVPQITCFDTYTCVSTNQILISSHLVSFALPSLVILQFPDSHDCRMTLETRKNQLKNACA